MALLQKMSHRHRLWSAEIKTKVAIIGIKCHADQNVNNALSKTKSGEKLTFQGNVSETVEGDTAQVILVLTSLY